VWRLVVSAEGLVNVVLIGGLSDPGHGLSLLPCLWTWPVDRWILKVAQQTLQVPVSLGHFKVSL